MARFHYKAANRDGGAVQGVVAAASEEAAFARLRDMGMFVTALSPEHSGGISVNIEDIPLIRQTWRLATGGRVAARPMALFTRQFASLLAAGVPLRRALEILSNQTQSGNLRHALERVGRDIDDGVTLAEAFARQPAAFSTLFVSMVKAGEKSGSLERVLKRLAYDMERRQTLRGQVRSALMYPTFVMSLAGIILTLILIFIVPKFQDIYQQMGRELPWMTQALMGASAAVLNHAPLVVGGTVLLIALFFASQRLASGRLQFDRLRMRLPVFGALLQMSSVARFARMFSTTLESGVPILEAIDLVSHTTGSEVLNRATKRLGLAVREGESVAEAVAADRAYPALIVQMLAIGEETGELDQMLTRAAEIYEEDVETTVKGLTSILEPALIVVLGVMIGFVVIALYLPIFDVWKGIDG